MWLPIVSLVFSLLAAASVLACAFFGQPWLALVPLGLIVLYMLVAFWASAGSAASLEWFADHVYFLGYVSTITAFAGVVLRAWFKGESLDDPRAVLLMGGVALLTTVAGLIGMTFLRSCARVLEPVEWREPSLEPSLRQRATPPPATAVAPEAQAGATAAPVTAFAAVDPGGRELRDVSVQATRSIEQLGEQLRVLNEGVARLHNIVSRSNPEVETLIRNVVEVQSVLDEFVGFIGSKLENESLRNVEGGR